MCTTCTVRVVVAPAKLVKTPINIYYGRAHLADIVYTMIFNEFKEEGSNTETRPLRVYNIYIRLFLRPDAT